MSGQKSKDVMELFSRAEEVVKVFSTGKRFVEELMRENERLRYKLMHLQQELARVKGAGQAGGSDVAQENLKLRRELEAIKAHFDNLSRENQDFQARYEEVEKQNENLLNLYVSGYQLHSTLSEESVKAVIQEILLNLVGAEVFVLWVVDQQTGELSPLVIVDEGGLLGEEAPALPASTLRELASGQGLFHSGDGRGRPAEPLACIPLQLEERTMGILAVYRLLEQKEGFTSLDQELLGLLTSQAATALIGSMIVSRRREGLRWLEAPPG